MSQSGQYCSYTFLCISCDLPPQCPLACSPCSPLGLLLSMPDSSQLKRSEGRVEGLSVNLQTTLFIIIISKDYPLFHTNHILYITSMPINSKIDKGKGEIQTIVIKRKQRQQWRKKTKTWKKANKKKDVKIHKSQSPPSWQICTRDHKEENIGEAIFRFT